MVPGGPGSRKGGAGGDGLKATMRPLTAGSKKVLAAGAAAFFVNLHAAVTALLPTVTSDLDFLEVPIPRRPALWKSCASTATPRTCSVPKARAISFVMFVQLKGEPRCNRERPRATPR